MKKKIASFFIRLAYKVYPEAKEIVIEQADKFQPMKLAKGYKIEKNDIRKYLKAHPEYKSYRKAFTAIISETRQMIFAEIARGIEKNGLVQFQINKGNFEATVSGQLFVYGIQEKSTAAEGEASAEA